MRFLIRENTPSFQSICFRTLSYMKIVKNSKVRFVIKYGIKEYGRKEYETKKRNERMQVFQTL